MSLPALPPDDRLHELLADRALFGLTPEEQAELDRLLTGSSVDPELLERLAAEIARSGLPEPVDPLPANLRSQVFEQAVQQMSVRIAAPPTEAAPTRPTGLSPGRWPALSGWAVSGWLAAAACLLVTIGVWRHSQTTGRQPSLQEERQALLSRSDIIRLSWTATADPAGKGAAGDVVWCNAEQKGYMRFHGLPPNEPTQRQYQLWIIDGDRDAKYPVDGGVFDIPSSEEEVIVPIKAKLPVGHPTLFAVTVERPGGVVVSDRKRLPLLAQVPANPAG